MTLPIDPSDGQTRIPQQPGTEPPQEPSGFAVPEPPAKRRWWPWIAVAVAVLAVVGGVTYALLPTTEDRVVDRCQTAITNKLRSPSTAVYGDKVTVTNVKGNFGTYYEVLGTVDAQNGFGATVRGEYHCKVTRNNDGRWRVDESSVASS